MSTSREINWHDDNKVTSFTNPNDSQKPIHPPTLRVRGALSTGERRSGHEAHDFTPSSIEAKNALMVKLGVMDMHSEGNRFDLHCFEEELYLSLHIAITFPHSLTF